MDPDEALPEPPRRPRWSTWVVAGVGALLVVIGGVRLATSSAPPAHRSAPSPSSTARVAPVLPDFGSSSAASPKPTFVAIVPAIPGRPARTISADDGLPGAVRSDCGPHDGCVSLTGLPAAVVAALRDALPGTVLQSYLTIVRRTGGHPTLVLRQLIATVRSRVVIVTVDQPARPTSLDRTVAAQDSRTVQRVVGTAQIRVEARGQAGSDLPPAYLFRLASDRRLLVLN